MKIWINYNILKSKPRGKKRLVNKVFSSLKHYAKIWTLNMLQSSCPWQISAANIQIKFIYLGFLGGSAIKNLPASAGDTGSIPG